MKKNKFFICMLVIGIILLNIGCSINKDLPIAIVDVEDYGVIKAELYPQNAPNTVNNFIYLANSGIYDGLTFNKITEKVIQVASSTQNLGYTIEGEFEQNSIKNTIKHKKGTLSMVRSGDDMNSSTSQFFILREDNENMDGVNAAFGKVIEGMDIVDEIGKVKVDKETYKPIKSITIKSIRIVNNEGKEYEKPQIIEKTK